MSPKNKSPLSVSCIAVVVLCFIGFTVLNILYPIQGVKALLFLLPGIISLAVLRREGYSLRDCFIAIRPISKLGLILLLLPCLGVLLIVDHQHQFILNWSMLLIGIPISAISQELFFRSVVQVVLLQLMRQRLYLTALLQSLCFCVWHLREFLLHPHMLYILITVPMLLALGFLWGVQVMKDRSILYTVIMHSLFLIPIRL